MSLRGSRAIIATQVGLAAALLAGHLVSAQVGIGVAFLATIVVAAILVDG